MIPRKRFEPYFNMYSWGLGLFLDFHFQSVGLMLGPVGFQINWGKL